MLKIRAVQTFAATVDVSFPTDDPAKFEEGSFVASFRHISKNRYIELMDTYGKLGRGTASKEEVAEIKEEVLSHIPASDLDRISARLDALIPEGHSSVRDIVEFRTAAVNEVLAEARDLADENGTPYTGETARQLVLDNLVMVNATFDKFVSCYSGAAAKNSKPSPKR